MADIIGQFTQLLIGFLVKVLWVLGGIILLLVVIRIIKRLLYVSFVLRHSSEGYREYLLIKFPSLNEDRSSTMEEFLKSAPVFSGEKLVIY